ncbi:hypothetical protein [Dechloromonas sp.]|uniref:hypothetical protein n=1 Tax=Dechloromonas sp. TaxID=1917218 RepID=UPI00263F826A|nr:hypothetical protein [Dechloromonas sp.]
MQFPERQLAIQMESEFELIFSPPARTHDVLGSTTEAVAAGTLVVINGSQSLAVAVSIGTTSASAGRR